jgi:hypothetical protein
MESGTIHSVPLFSTGSGCGNPEVAENSVVKG